MITRRQSFLSFVFPFSLAHILPSVGSAKILQPSRVSRKIEVRTVPDSNRVEWEFSFYSLEPRDEPLVVGEMVRFDGGSFGAPFIDGRIEKIEYDEYPDRIQYVTVRSVG